MPLRLARPAVLATAALAYAAALVVVPSGLVPALAGPTGTASPDSAYYRSTVVAVEPPAPGLGVTVADGGAVTLENRTGSEVVVLGYAREPYLRFAEGGMVLRNRDALTTALVAGRTPGPTAGPAGKALVTWEHVAHEPRFTWTDVRARWSSAQRPPVVQQDEHAAHRVLDWALDVTVAGRPTQIRGVVDWTGTPVPPQEELLPWAVVAAVLTATLAGIVVMLRRRAGRRTVPAPAAPELVRTLHATPPSPRRSPHDSGSLAGPFQRAGAPTRSPYVEAPARPAPRRHRRGR